MVKKYNLYLAASLVLKLIILTQELETEAAGEHPTCIRMIKSGDQAGLIF